MVRQTSFRTIEIGIGIAEVGFHGVGERLGSTPTPNTLWASENL